MPFKDKKMRAEYQLKWKKTESYKQRVSIYIQRNLARRSKHREAVAKIKSKIGCEKCGEKDHRCLDFNHLNPQTKKHGISWMVANGFSLIKIKEEIKKCNILCSNCHRKITFK